MNENNEKPLWKDKELDFGISIFKYTSVLRFTYLDGKI